MPSYSTRALCVYNLVLMALQTGSSQNPAPALSEGPAGKRTWLVSMTSLVFIVLQSACTAVIAISGVRVAIGLSALAEATIGIHAPAGGFHRDVIRIPMMIAARLRNAFRKASCAASSASASLWSKDRAMT